MGLKSGVRSRSAGLTACHSRMRGWRCRCRTQLLLMQNPQTNHPRSRQPARAESKPPHSLKLHETTCHGAQTVTQPLRSPALPCLFQGFAFPHTSPDVHVRSELAVVMPFSFVEPLCAQMTKTTSEKNLRLFQAQLFELFSLKMLLFSRTKVPAEAWPHPADASRRKHCSFPPELTGQKF